VPVRTACGMRHSLLELDLETGAPRSKDARGLTSAHAVRVPDLGGGAPVLKGELEAVRPFSGSCQRETAPRRGCKAGGCPAFLPNAKRAPRLLRKAQQAPHVFAEGKDTLFALAPAVRRRDVRGVAARTPGMERSSPWPTNRLGRGAADDRGRPLSTADCRQDTRAN